MEKQSLARNLGNSLTGEVVNCISNIAEISLDSILEDGIIKEVPFYSTVVSLYKIGKSFKDRHYLKKLNQFLAEINNGIVDENMRIEYIEKLKQNESARNQELEYVLVLIDRSINYEKPRWFAKLYLSYLAEKISWDEFSMFTEVIERLFDVDIAYLVTDTTTFFVHQYNESDSILRLVALGLVAEIPNNSPFGDNGRGGLSITVNSLNSVAQMERQYIKTEFGIKFTDALK